MNMSFKNVCLLDFLAAKNAISHHTFHIQYNHIEKRKAKKKLSLFKHIHNIAKVTISSVMSVRLPVCVRTEQLGSHWMDFMKFDV
jgi:hypothetical protein